jgi:hypothetical protein
MKKLIIITTIRALATVVVIGQSVLFAITQQFLDIINWFRKTVRSRFASVISFSCSLLPQGHRP